MREWIRGRGGTGCGGRGVVGRLSSLMLSQGPHPPSPPAPTLRRVRTPSPPACAHSETRRTRAGRQAYGCVCQDGEGMYLDGAVERIDPEQECVTLCRSRVRLGAKVGVGGQHLEVVVGVEHSK